MSKQELSWDIPVTDFKTNTIEVIIIYTKGGYNYFHGRTNPRCYAIHFMACNLSTRDGFTYREHGMFDGKAIILKEVKMFSAKTLDKIGNLVKDDVTKLAELYKLGHFSEINQYIAELKAKL